MRVQMRLSTLIGLKFLYNTVLYKSSRIECSLVVDFFLQIYSYAVQILRYCSVLFLLPSLRLTLNLYIIKLCTVG
jgi:hypothetical protein